MSFRAIVCLLHMQEQSFIHISKEDVKMVALFRCWVLFVHNNNIIGFIVDFIITLLVSYVWKVCNETMLCFVDSIFLCSLFTRHQNSQYLKRIISVFFSVFYLMNCYKFQKPMMKPILKKSIAKYKLWNKMSKHKMIFYVNENKISKVMLLVLAS